MTLEEVRQDIASRKETPPSTSLTVQFKEGKQIIVVDKEGVGEYHTWQNGRLIPSEDLIDWPPNFQGD